MNPVRIASLSLAAALALAPAVPAQESAPETPAPPALRLHDIRTIAVSPFTSGGNVDTFCASIFTTRARDLPGIDRVMDPLELRVSIPDGQPFHIEPVLPTLLAEARGRGADALAVGVGKWYDWGFRLEIKLVEVNRGEVVWSSERASGISFSGPSAKREVVREMIDELRRDLNGKRRVARR